MSKKVPLNICILGKYCVYCVLCTHVHFYAPKAILQFQLCKNFCDYKLFIKISNSPLLNCN